MQKICTKCKTPFDCTENEHCWCAELTDKLQKSQIAANCDCLCKNCLQQNLIHLNKDSFKAHL